MKKYESMVYLTRPVSTRKAMSKGNRAAQFAPFAALSGHDVAIQRATMKKEERIELSEDQKRTLNEKIVECDWTVYNQNDEIVTRDLSTISYNLEDVEMVDLPTDITWQDVVEG